MRRENTIGYVDAIGNFILFLWEHHVDMYKEENLGFFKKMSYNEKMKELYESMLQPLCKKLISLNRYFVDLIKEIVEPEQQKFLLWECYVDRV